MPVEKHPKTSCFNVVTESEIRFRPSSEPIHYEPWCLFPEFSPYLHRDRIFRGRVPERLQHHAQDLKGELGLGETFSDLALRASFMLTGGVDDSRLYDWASLYEGFRGERAQTGDWEKALSIVQQKASKVFSAELDDEHSKNIVRVLEMIDRASGVGEPEVLHKIASMDETPTAAYLVWLIATFNSQSVWTPEWDHQIGLRLQTLASSETPLEDNSESPLLIQKKHLDGRVAFSNGLVLARDTHARFSLPWAFHFGNDVLAQVTGIPDYGYRFCYLRSTNPLSDFLPSVYEWYVESCLSGLTGSEGVIPIEVGQKGVWGMVSKACGDKTVAESVTQIALSILPPDEVIFPEQYESHFGKARATALTLDRLLASRNFTGPSREELIELIKNKMKSISDLVRMRMFISHGIWDECLSLIAQDNFSPDKSVSLLRSTTMTDGTEIKNKRVVEPSHLRESSVEIRQELIQRGSTDDGTLPFAALVVRGKTNLGLGPNIGVPIEIQIAPLEIAQANWGARRTHNIRA